MYKYLKEGSYYDDLYDLGTVEECIRVQEYWKKRGYQRRIRVFH